MSDKENEPENEESNELTMEETTSLGAIQIKHTVIENIVRLATEDVDGVVGIPGSLGKAVGGWLKGQQHASGGIGVEEDPNGNYLITVRIILTFGVNLADTAKEVQESIRGQVLQMTNKHVAKVDVFIEDVKMPEPEPVEPETAWDDKD